MRRYLAGRITIPEACERRMARVARQIKRGELVCRELCPQQRLTIAQLVAITGANRNTLKVRLRELVQAGRLRQYGKARATWYSANGG